ncbi:cytochrome P450 [Aspergillus foveolatus]|uniref:cytochrome P450 n=1 Tax=Aspergillus foveolatus TaxID=210207 RepID=UPI003CCDE5B1
MDFLMEYGTTADFFTVFATLWLVYCLLRMLYNVSPLHPLSHIPGPNLAAATFLYESWFDLVLGGKYTHKIKKMHEEYGPVVRINPEELHFNDISFANEIYAGPGRKRNKQVHYLNIFAGPTTSSMLATVEHGHHRARRSAVNRFFSRAQISKLESNIKDLASGLCDKMIRLAYSCFSGDVISKYCFGEPFGFIAQEEWEPNYRNALNATQAPVHVFRSFPFLKRLTDIAPLCARWASPGIREMLIESNERMPARIQKARQDCKRGITETQPSLFAALLDAPLPEAEKTDQRLGGEGFLMIAAGTETTAWTLTVITFHLLNQPDTLNRLRSELQDSDAINLQWFALERLPYLTAVIREGLRLSYGVSQRISRIAPTETLVYRGEHNGRRIEYSIPPGTTMGMSNAINHHNEDAFPDSDAFIPERWINVDDAQRRRMDSCLTPFSKGSRQCLGINLAYCNLYLALTALTLRVLPWMSLYETTVDDVRYHSDSFAPLPKKGTKGVRAVISYP